MPDAAPNQPPSPRSTRGRGRRVAKWAGLVVCVAIAAGFVVSTWRSAYWYPDPRTMIVLGNGQVTVMYSRYSDARDFTPASTDANPHGGGQWWWYPRFFDGGNGTWAHLPLWCLFAAVLIPTAMLWYRDSARYRRRHPLRCAGCGYDRRGLGFEVVCPECGASGPGSAKAKT